MNKVKLRRAILKLFYIFPIRKRKAFFTSFAGKFISCNPKYIYLGLKERYGGKIKYVWDFNGKKEGVKCVKHNSLKYVYHVMTAGVIVSNFGVNSSFPLRKKQISINTWHGSGAYKKVALAVKSGVDDGDEKTISYTAANTTYFISGCRKFTEVTSASKLVPEDRFLPIGTPRNDMLINGVTEEYKRHIREKAGIPSDKKIVLYAPTFRGKFDDPEKEAGKLLPEPLLKALEKRFGGEWALAYRCHYTMLSQESATGASLNLSAYDDMQELLLVADALITDYSSSIWDYSFLRRPCFLYCYDLDGYKSERDFYVPIERWGFPIAETMDGLCEKILSFDEAAFEENMRRHHEELGSFEEGTATEKICDIIADKLNLTEGDKK